MLIFSKSKIRIHMLRSTHERKLGLIQINKNLEFPQVPHRKIKHLLFYSFVICERHPKKKKQAKIKLKHNPYY